jgi:glycosyltransferase involved in cell wall biosynthesis
MGSGASGADRLTICYPLSGNTLGGSHQSLLGLLRLLDQRRFRPLLVVDQLDGDIAKHFAGFEIVVDPAPFAGAIAPGRPFGLIKLLRVSKGLLRRARFLREQGVSIVHTNDGRSHAIWALAAKLAGCKMVWHHRADPTAKGLRYLAPFVADQIVTVSQFSLPRNRFFSATRNAQVVFSPFRTDICADRAAMRERILAELGLSPDTVICGYFGGFLARKRPLLFIDAVARLREIADGPIAGVMFGEAVHADVAAEMDRELAMPRVGGAVHLMGYRSPGWEWIAACDILMVPAIHEPLGRTLIEAMLVGTPVVATRSGGTPEAIVDGCGILVPPENADALARGCLEVITNPAATTQMIALAQARARAHFGEDRHVERIAAIYTTLIAADSGP